ncbi:Hypothetical predicted protein [Marmota monax]|uniref:Uncharacterized protein n=1 Tax=Marmota monax TaxID=9995 RepID=A0A5E4BX63_MARMO|nr:Hypothetical predicted protein [Marmota monax]
MEPRVTTPSTPASIQFSRERGNKFPLGTMSRCTESTVTLINGKEEVGDDGGLFGIGVGVTDQRQGGESVTTIKTLHRVESEIRFERSNLSSSRDYKVALFTS